MDEAKRANSVKDYLEYLTRIKRTSTMSYLDLHKQALSREVAREYGVTESEMQVMELEMEDRKNGEIDT